MTAMATLPKEQLIPVRPTGSLCGVNLPRMSKSPQPAASPDATVGSTVSRAKMTTLNSAAAVMGSLSR